MPGKKRKRGGNKSDWVRVGWGNLGFLKAELGMPMWKTHWKNYISINGNVVTSCNEENHL